MEATEIAPRQELETEEVLLTIPSFLLDFLELSAQRSGMTISEYLTSLTAWVMVNFSFNFWSSALGQDGDAADCNSAEAGSTPAGASDHSRMGAVPA